MVPGLSIQMLVNLHVAISLAGIVTGLVAMTALARGRWRSGWQGAFLATTALTSITGFLFPFSGVTPAFLFGIASMAVLAVAAAALPARARSRKAGVTYVVTAMIALYLNLFVLVVQGFQKVAALHALAPTQSELPFAASQLVVLVFCLVIGVLAIRALRRGVVSLLPGTASRQAI